VEDEDESPDSKFRRRRGGPLPPEEEGIMFRQLMWSRGHFLFCAKVSVAGNVLIVPGVGLEPGAHSLTVVTCGWCLLQRCRDFAALLQGSACSVVTR